MGRSRRPAAEKASAPGRSVRRREQGVSLVTRTLWARWLDKMIISEYKTCYARHFPKLSLDWIKVKFSRFWELFLKSPWWHVMGGSKVSYSHSHTFCSWSKYKYLDSTAARVTLPIVYPHPGRGHNKLFSSSTFRPRPLPRETLV